MASSAKEARRAAKARQQHSRNEFLWRQDRRRAEQAHRDLIRDADQADAERERTTDRVKAIMTKAQADAERAASEVAKRFAAEERRLLSAPITRYTGATRTMSTGLVVWHWKATCPVALAARLGITRADAGPLAVLRPGGGLTETDSAPDVFASLDASLLDDSEFMDWAAQVAELWHGDVRERYQVLGRLRDDTWFARLAESAGIADPQTKPETLAGRYGPVERKVTTVSIPTIQGVEIERGGLVITCAHRPGDPAEQWMKSVPALRAGFKAAGMNADSLRVSETSSGDVRLVFDDVDPFQQTPPVAVYDAEKFRSRLGITQHGEDAWITWAGSSGMVVGGVPGSGKTASMLPVFAAMRDEVELHVFDGKAGYDLHPLRHIAATYDNSGDVSAPLETVRRLDRLRVLRAEALYEKAGINNFWNAPAAVRRKLGMVPVVLVLDEVQTWTDTSGLSKDEKAVAEEITALVRSLIQKGRSAGIVTILTTQKPDATTIPTKIRDNASLKLSFRVSTVEQAVTILGKQSPGAPDPTHILISQRGRCVMETKGHGIQLIQAGYQSTDELEAELADAKPVTDQYEVAMRLLGKPVETSAEETAPTVEQPETLITTSSDTTAMSDDERREAVRQEAVRLGLIPDDESVEEPENTEKTEENNMPRRPSAGGISL